MLLNRTFALASICLFAFSAPSVSEETSKILFSNPLVRENAGPLKLQSLRFVTVDDFAPFSAFDANGTLRGVHVDLARAICAELQITTGCTLQAAQFDDVESLLISSQADVALAGLVPNAQNRKNLGFSVPYFRYSSKFLARKNMVLDSKTVVGVVKDSAHQTMVKVLFPNLKQEVFETDLVAFSALKAGTVSALFGDGLAFALAQSSDPTFDCCALQSANYFLPAVRADTLRAATSAARPDILLALDSALKQIAVDGRLDEIYLRYLPINPLQ